MGVLNGSSPLSSQIGVSDCFVQIVRLFRCFVERGRIEARVPPILRRLGLSESQWQKQVSATKSRYCRAIGSLDSLLRLTETLGQNWIRGTSFARAIARNS